MAWTDHVTRQEARYRDGLARLPDDIDARQRQLTRVANAALGAGFAQLMDGNGDQARTWLLEAASRYRESYEGAPKESWGRMIGAVKLRLIAGDSVGARADAEWTLANGAAGAESPIGWYAACVAQLVLGEDAEAAKLATGLVEAPEGFPADVAAALQALATGDAASYGSAIGSVVRSFETRAEHLEDVPIADTALMLNVLASERDLALELVSPLVPTGSR
ncbi:MAG: hypothetical protein ACR2OD_10295 [Gaiellaceae bacterium]